MADITSVGVGSGLDLESLVNNIITAERAPTETRLNLKEAETQATISAYGGLKGTLAAFQSSLEDIKSTGFYSSRRASSGDSTIFTATAESTASLASYNIAVTALAQESKVGTNGGFASPDATVGEGTLTIGLIGGNSFDVVVGVTDSLATIRDTINNASDNVGVTASLINISATQTELVITSNDSGANNQIDISVIDLGDGNNTDANGLSRLYFDGNDPAAISNQMNSSRIAQDASIIIDNFTLVSDTNTFADAIDGISITAVSESADAQTTTALTIETDTLAVNSKITSFAAGFNEVMTVLNTLTNYDATTETRGILGSDAGARLIEQQIRRVSSNFVEGAPTDFNSLAFIGFQTNQNGTITLDSEQLSAALESNFDDFASLFAGDNGIATKLDKLLGSFLDGDGTIPTKENSLRTTLDQIKDDRASLDLRLEIIEARFRSQFTALDILVSQLTRTGEFLQSQLSAASKITTRER